MLFMSFCYVHLYAQVMPLQTFSLAADRFVYIQEDGMDIDWRLDLGVTAIQLQQSNTFLFSAGFLQPNINRFKKEVWEKYNPGFSIKYNFLGNAITLVSKEPDLILYGFKIFDLNGQELISNKTKYLSSYLSKPIEINTLANGIYIMQIYYLPELMTADHYNAYWVKHIKFIKP